MLGSNLLSAGALTLALPLSLAILRRAGLDMRELVDDDVSGVACDDESGVGVRAGDSAKADEGLGGRRGLALWSLLRPGLWLARLLPPTL